MRFLTLKDVDVEGKRVLVRTDFNVPLKEGKVVDDTRLRESLPTLNYLLEHNAKIIILTSAGRPKGKVVDELRLDPVAKKLSELLNKEVKKLDECTGRAVWDAVKNMKSSDVVMLENLRFRPEEEQNDDGFARELASLGELYVNDAFANCHRRHASMCAITKFLPSCAGLLVEKEVKTITEALSNPERPFVAVLGGAKLETKIPVINNLLERVDKLLLGGAMIYTFFKAQGVGIGKSVCDEALVEEAKTIMEKGSGKLLLPVDVVVAESSESEHGVVVDIKAIPDEMMGLDIGEKTLAVFEKELKNAKTILWNGPLGFFENPAFANGTLRLAKTIASTNAKTIVGGGDTAAAVAEAGVAEKITHVSTGGGASLKLFAGEELPALKALEECCKKHSKKRPSVGDYISPLHKGPFQEE